MSDVSGSGNGATGARALGAAPPPTAPAGRTTLPVRTALRARYAWEQTADPLVAGVHEMITTRVLPFVSTVSVAGGDAPSLGYAGVPHGIVKVQQTLEALREAAGAPTVTSSRTRVRRAALFDGGLPDTDLVAVGCGAAQAAALPAHRAMVLPFRLHLVVDLSGQRDEWRRAVSRRERQWFSARSREREWALDVATDEDAFRFFYRRMHLPTMWSRHAERTRSEPEDVARECLFRDGLLAFATVDGVRVAGALCHRSDHGRTVTVRLLGVLDGAAEMYDLGALKAIYHLLLGWADHHGVRRVDLGGTETWLSKGLFQWKRRFGPRVVLAPNHLGRLRVWWHARHDTPAVRDFLVANPVLEIVGGGEFGAVHFLDDDRPARRDLAFACPNVARHRTVHLDDFFSTRSDPG